MSQQDHASEADNQQRSNEELEPTTRQHDDRWTLDYGNSPDDFLARLHLQPGEAVPDWFETCVYCSGAKCGECDQIGRIHPKRVEYFEDWLLQAQEGFFLFLEVYRREEVAVPRMHAAIATLGPIMGEFLGKWEEADPRLGAVFEEIQKTWTSPAS